MGYSTDFAGQLTITPPLNDDEISYLTDFSESRRVQRAEGPLCLDGTVLDNNTPPDDQPGLWCDFVPNDDGTAVEWNGNEKTYDGDTWIAYLVTRLLAPSAKNYLVEHSHEDPRLASFTCDHVVNGFINAFGENHDDIWSIEVKNNQVSRCNTQLVPGDPTPVTLP